MRSFSQEPNPSLSASALMNYDANQALPAVSCHGGLRARHHGWTPQPNLLHVGPADRNFVVEVEFDGTAHLRFGDNINGLSPRTAPR